MKFEMTGKKNRVDMSEKVTEVESAPVNKVRQYYQVNVGNYGVILPTKLNLDTLNGLQLIEGRASAIFDQGLAIRIADKTGGKLLLASEIFTRSFEEVVEPDSLPTFLAGYNE